MWKISKIYKKRSLYIKIFYKFQAYDYNTHKQF